MDCQDMALGRGVWYMQQNVHEGKTISDNSGNKRACMEFVIVASPCICAKTYVNVWIHVVIRFGSDVGAKREQSSYSAHKTHQKGKKKSLILLRCP